MKISDWILEQDISTASCDDIGLAQCFAEMEVLSALMECYAKQELIQEYCSGDIREFDIYMESGDEPEEESSEGSDDSGEKKSNKFKDFMSDVGGKIKNTASTVKNKTKGATSTVGSTAKRWWGSIIELVTRIGQLIVKLFSRVSYTKIKKKVEASDINMWYIPYDIAYMSDMLDSLIKYYGEFSTLLTSKTTDISKYNKLYNSIIDTEKRDESELSSLKDSKMSASKKDLLDFIENLIQIQENGIPKVSKMLNDLNYAKKDYKDMENAGEMVKIIKSCASKLHSTFTKVNSEIMTVTNKIVKDAIKTDKKTGEDINKSKKNTSDDGYNHEDDI